jgi:hypothetical protein
MSGITFGSDTECGSVRKGSKPSRDGEAGALGIQIM